MKLYAIFDMKAKAYKAPFFADSNIDAMRELSVGLKSDGVNKIFLDYPEDFALYYIADFDRFTGKITHIDSTDVVICPPPVFLEVFTSLLSKKSEDNGDFLRSSDDGSKANS